MDALSDIEPKEHELVMDLVDEAGVDVSGWANFAGGPDKAASNPKYCYEWSFVEPKKVVVLNLWYGLIEERNGTILQEFNMRQVGHKFRRSGNYIGERRAQRMDSAIQTAIREKLPVRVIVCEGDRRDAEDPEAKASHVQKRLLDPLPWAVTAYDPRTGQCVVSRSTEPPIFLDQFSLREDPSAPPERRAASGQIFLRSRTVRLRALVRAQGKCEWCHEPGFAMADGRVFLETHHVVPLADGGRDTPDNVVALCPNHHREVHHGVRKTEMRDSLLRTLRGSSAR